uniref:Glycosyltransferase n=1 Tax=Roseihalotalea indica TaxID=2867963 RepID=A0AA49JEQ6_9BACT|nr:glycosyltransferase [Tunicatimonas sp. TK19036]
MSHQDIQQISQVYFKRFKSHPPQLSAPIAPDTKIIIIIPCYNEPDIITTLRSLAQNNPPRYPVEVLIVINAGLQDAPQVYQQNQQTQQQVTQWIEEEQPHFLHCHTIYVDDLPKKHAGVGLARKIGMDEALYRFSTIAYDGFIMNLDADCRVAANYLTALEEAWLTQTLHTCTVHFEHDLETITNANLREGIVYYELFLRYYINGLCYANFPFAFHTVGSCMGARASTYALCGGMNRRKAGEDFYFLHKIAPLGEIVQVRNTTVYPSARLSDRVPFGTGKAQQEWLDQSDRHRFLYHPQIFEELHLFLEAVPAWYEASWNWDKIQTQPLPDIMREFLRDQDFAQVWNNLQSSTRSWTAFRKRFFAWLDGFRVLKYVHYARENGYKSLPAEEAGFTLLQKLRILNSDEELTAEELLEKFRGSDRQGY